MKDNNTDNIFIYGLNTILLYGLTKQEIQWIISTTPHEFRFFDRSESFTDLLALPAEAIIVK